jgi:hypothetical protein
MNIQKNILAIVLGFALAGAANAQVISYHPRTGDITIDNELGYMNGYGRQNQGYFVDDVVNSYGAPRYLVNDLLNTRRWEPGDVYYACALAYQVRRPCGDVVNMYEQDRGQGWGVIAKRLGIKPGSPQFHALKGDVSKGHGKFKSHPYKGDNKAPGNQGSPGNSGKSNGGSQKGGNSNGNAGKSDNGKGNGNSGKPKGGKP